jgi:hypothetical protein
MYVTVPRLTRNPDVVIREVDDSVFLVGPRNDGVFHLNSTGAAVWRLLAEPVSAAEAEQILVSAFPDVPPDQVREDLAALINGLDARGFLVRVD